MEQSERLNLYKEFYFKELANREELNNAISLPIGVLTGIISLHVFMLSAEISNTTRVVLMCIASMNVPLIITIIFYLGKSFTNLGRAHTYRFVAGMKKYYEYHNQLVEANRLSDFEPYIEKEIAECADHNFSINAQRMKDIAQAKKALFFSIFIAFVFSIVYVGSLITNIDKMAKTETNNQTQDGTKQTQNIIVPPPSLSIESTMPDKFDTVKTINNEKPIK